MWSGDVFCQLLQSADRSTVQRCFTQLFKADQRAISFISRVFPNLEELRVLNLFELDTKKEMEQYLVDRDTNIKTLESSILKMSEEHGQALSKSKVEIDTLNVEKENLMKEHNENKICDTEFEMKKEKSRILEIVELKAKLKKIQSVLNDELEIANAEQSINLNAKDYEITSLKGEVKKSFSTKEDEISTMKSKIEATNNGELDSLREEMKNALKAKDEELNLKLNLKEEEIKQNIEEANRSIRKKENDLIL
jgi:hypothetical protein